MRASKPLLTATAMSRRAFRLQPHRGLTTVSEAKQDSSIEAFVLRCDILPMGEFADCSQIELQSSLRDKSLQIVVGSFDIFSAELGFENLHAVDSLSFLGFFKPFPNEMQGGKELQLCSIKLAKSG